MRDLKEIFFVVLRKWWIFVLVLVVCIGGNVLLAGDGEVQSAQCVVSGTFYIAQTRNENVGDFIDNAARNQPALDSMEILRSGRFWKALGEQPGVDMEIEELKGAFKFERILQSRVIKFDIGMDDRAKLERVSQAFIQLAPEYLMNIMDGTVVSFLDDGETLTVKENTGDLYTPKRGIVQGLALCCIIAILMGLAYFSNDSVRFSDEITSMGLALAGELKKEKNDDTAKQNAIEIAKLAACLRVSREVRKVLVCSSYEEEGSEAIAAELASNLAQMAEKVLYLSSSDNPARQMEELGAEYDYVVVSGKALSESSQSIIMADQCDITLLVVEANRIGRHLLMTNVERLKAGQHVVVEILFNRVEKIYGVLKKTNKKRR